MDYEEIQNIKEKISEIRVRDSAWIIRIPMTMNNRKSNGGTARNNKVIDLSAFS